MKQLSIEPKFVELIPTQLDDGILYISQKYQTAIHKCCCGCGQEVVTPLSSAQWRVEVAKGKVSLFPSIGNWNSACKSHYWIKQNRIDWSYAFSDHDIRQVQARDRHDLQEMTQYKNLQKDLIKNHSNNRESTIFGKCFSVLQRLWKSLIT